MLDSVIFIIYLILSWTFLTRLQKSIGIGFIVSLSDYFIYKFIFSIIFGWIIIPFGLIGMLFSSLFRKKNMEQ